MIPVRNATLEFRFKKSMPSLEAKLAGNTRGQIFLQQKFYIQEYDETNMQDMLIPVGTDPEEAIPPQLIPHVQSVGPTVKGLHVKVPSLAGVHIQWFNIPAVDQDAPDREEINLPKPPQGEPDANQPA